MDCLSMNQLTHRKIEIQNTQQRDVYDGLGKINDDNQFIKTGFGNYYSNSNEELNEYDAKHIGYWKDDNKEGLGAVLSKSNGFTVGNYKDDTLSGFGAWFYFDNEMPSSLSNVKEVFCGEFVGGKPHYGVFYCDNSDNEHNNAYSSWLKSPLFVKEINHYVYIGTLDANGRKNDGNGFVYDYNAGCVVYGHFVEDKIKECYQLVLDKEKNYDVVDAVFISFCEDFENIKEIWHSQVVEMNKKGVLDKVKEYITSVLLKKFIVDNNMMKGLLNNKVGNSFFEIVRKENKFIGNYETDLKQFYDEIHSLMQFEPFVI